MFDALVSNFESRLRIPKSISPLEDGSDTEKFFAARSPNNEKIYDMSVP